MKRNPFYLGEKLSHIFPFLNGKTTQFDNKTGLKGEPFDLRGEGWKISQWQNLYFPTDQNSIDSPLKIYPCSQSHCNTIDAWASRRVFDDRYNVNC